MMLTTAKEAMRLDTMKGMKKSMPRTEISE
jgi:hypothetical protein